MIGPPNHSVWHYDFLLVLEAVQCDSKTESMGVKSLTLTVFSLTHKFKGPCVSDSLWKISLMETLIITVETRNETYSLKLKHLNILGVIYNAVSRGPPVRPLFTWSPIPPSHTRTNAIPNTNSIPSPNSDHHPNPIPKTQTIILPD